MRRTPGAARGRGQHVPIRITERHQHRSQSPWEDPRRGSGEKVLNYGPRGARLILPAGWGWAQTSRQLELIGGQEVGTTVENTEPF